MATKDSGIKPNVWASGTVFLTSKQDMHTWTQFAESLTPEVCKYHWLNSLITCMNCMSLVCEICTKNHKCDEKNLNEQLLKQRRHILTENLQIVSTLIRDSDELKNAIVNYELQLLTTMLESMLSKDENNLIYSIQEALRLKLETYHVMKMIFRIDDESNDVTKLKLSTIKKKITNVYRKFCFYDSLVRKN